MSDLEKSLYDEEIPLSKKVGGPSMADLLSESDQLYTRVAGGTDLLAKIENVTEHLEEIAAVTSQESGLSDYSRSLISNVHKTLTGQPFMADRLLALESVDGADNEFKDGVVAEIQKNTLNEFLVGLKSTFYSSWGDTKSWYAKAVSLREAIDKKNKDTMDRSSKVTGDPKTLEFIFKENVDVDNNGKCSYQEILVGMEALVAYTEKRLSAKVDKEYEDFVVGIQRVIDGYKTKGEADQTELLKYKDLYTPPPEVLTSKLEDKTVVEKLTDSENADLSQTRRFPGAAYVVISKPSAQSGATPYSFIEDTWVKLYVEDQGEKKNEVHVRTFYPNQILHMSELIGQLLDSLGYFDKSWERRDKFMTKVFTSLDKTISLLSEKLTDSSQDKKTDEELRGLTRMMIRSIQLDNTFNSMLINFVIKISAQLNELNNVCLLQYNQG